MELLLLNWIFGWIPIEIEYSLFILIICYFLFGWIPFLLTYCWAVSWAVSLAIYWAIYWVIYWAPWVPDSQIKHSMVIVPVCSFRVRSGTPATLVKPWIYDHRWPLCHDPRPPIGCQPWHGHANLLRSHSWIFPAWWPGTVGQMTQFFKKQFFIFFQNYLIGLWILH